MDDLLSDIPAVTLATIRAKIDGDLVALLGAAYRHSLKVRDPRDDGSARAPENFVIVMTEFYPVEDLQGPTAGCSNEVVESSWTVAFSSLNRGDQVTRYAEVLGLFESVVGLLGGRAWWTAIGANQGRLVATEPPEPEEQHLVWSVTVRVRHGVATT